MTLVTRISYASFQARKWEASCLFSRAYNAGYRFPALGADCMD